ncbi:hypothetical protein M9H77_06877 [Catharanthus roseus]|uniref:Uncharacterized protein n=1 Tax=Catharanthus roseus TaxID=4058 RepID=A0ACC0BTM4_CATRO|nr:hypothetical protein M9H77_06877 [Catharanthus roseus]
MMGRDFRVGYESYKGSRYCYMDDGYGHWYPYEQEANLPTTLPMCQKICHPLSRQKEARKTCAQKKFIFEEKLSEVRVISNERIGKTNYTGEPSGSWSKKSENKESTRSQELKLDNNDTCEGKESHERREKVEERERISVEHSFLDAIPFLFEKVERDESEISEERKEGTMKEQKCFFEEHERINEEKGSESVKERHHKSSYSLELKLESFLNKRKRIRGKLHHNHQETSISFLSDSLPLSIEFSLKELKLFLNAHESYEDGTDYCSYVANVGSFLLGVENKEERMLGIFEIKERA